MSRPDLYPNEVEEWQRSAHAPLHTDPRFPSDTQIAKLQSKTDSLAERLRASHQAPSPWIGTVLVALVVLVIAAAAAIGFVYSKGTPCKPPACSS